MKGFLVGTAILVSIAAAIAPVGQSRITSPWYWSPNGCKGQLQGRGVQLGDGRMFYVAKAYCVGYHDHCWLTGGVRMYKVFAVAARSYDGVVRVWQLTVTGHSTWTGTPTRVVSQYTSPAEFNDTYGPTAWSVAVAENQKGCYDIHP